MSLVPYAKVKPALQVQLPCTLEVDAGRETAAIGGSAQGRRSIMDAATSLIQIDTLSIGFVGEHTRSRNVRMRFCSVLCDAVFRLKSDSVTLATECAPVARHLFHGGLLCHGNVPSSITAEPCSRDRLPQALCD